MIIIALISNKEYNSLPLRGAAFTIEIPINLICAGWQGFTNVLPVHVQVYTYEMSEQRVDWLFKQAFKRLEGVAKPRLFPRRLTKDARIWIEKREESLYIYIQMLVTKVSIHNTENKIFNILDRMESNSKLIREKYLLS